MFPTGAYPPNTLLMIDRLVQEASYMPRSHSRRTACFRTRGNPAHMHDWVPAFAGELI